MASTSFVSLLSTFVPFDEKLLRFVCFQTVGENPFFLRPNRALGVFVDKPAAQTAHFEIVLQPDDDDWVQLRTAREEFLAVSDMPLRPLNLTKTSSTATQFRLEQLGDQGHVALRSRKTDKWVKPAPGYWANGTGSAPTPFRVYRMPSFHARRVCECGGSLAKSDPDSASSSPQLPSPASPSSSFTSLPTDARAPSPVAAAGGEALVSILQSLDGLGLSVGTSKVIGTVEAIVSSISAATLLARQQGRDLCPLCEGVLQKPGARIDNQLDLQLLLCVEANDLFDLEVLLQAGADAHVRCVEETTLLHLAAATNSVRIIPRLITELDIDVRDRNGCTALFYAAVNNCEEAKQLLLDSGASRDCIPQNAQAEEAVAQAEHQTE